MQLQSSQSTLSPTTSLQTTQTTVTNWVQHGSPIPPPHIGAPGRGSLGAETVILWRRGPCLDLALALLVHIAKQLLVGAGGFSCFSYCWQYCVSASYILLLTILVTYMHSAICWRRHAPGCLRTQVSLESNACRALLSL